MERFNLFYEDTLLGTIGYDKKSGIYSFIKSDEKSNFPPEFSEDIFKGYPKEFITSDDVKEFVVERVFPDNRQALDVYLDILDLGAWDPWEIFVRCSGLFATDRYWIDSYEVTKFDERVRRLDGFKDRERKCTHPELLMI